MIQNHPSTEPETNPNPKNKAITIAAISDSEGGTDLGAIIIMTLVRYPLVNPKTTVNNTTNTSFLAHLGPCKHAVKSGYNNNLAIHPHVALAMLLITKIAVNDFPKKSEILYMVIKIIGYQSLRRVDSMFSAKNPGKIDRVTVYMMNIPIAGH